MNDQASVENNDATTSNPNDSRKILTMVQTGKITVDEAEQLLGAFAPSEPSVYGTELGERELPKFLVVQISSDTDEVNVRLPVKLLSLGVDLSKLNPAIADAIDEAVPGTLHGLTGLKGDELREALQGLAISIKDEEDSVRVYCE